MNPSTDANNKGKLKPPPEPTSSGTTINGGIGKDGDNVFVRGKLKTPVEGGTATIKGSAGTASGFGFYVGYEGKF
jgi:hypothetical protein